MKTFLEMGHLTVIASALLLCLLPIVAGRDPCSGCRYDAGVGYKEDSRDCRKFYQCLNYGVTNIRKTCAMGTYWSQEKLTCSPVRDRCSKDIPHPVHGEGEKWVARCDGSTRPGSGNTYQQEVFGHGLITRYCAPGTVYEISNCTCVHGGPATYQACSAELFIPFIHDDVKDVSHKKVHVVNSGVKVEGERGYFADNTELRINRFSNHDFRSRLTIKFQMKASAPATTRGRAVMSNSNCAEDGSIFIVVKKSVVEFRVINELKTLYVLSVPYKNKSGMNSVQLKIAAGTMEATVDGIKRSRSFKDNILRVQCALHIGKGTGYDNFIGYIDEFLVTSCKA